MPKRNKSLSITYHKVNKIDKSLIDIKLMLLAQHCNLATKIPVIPNFKLCYTKEKKQIVDQKIADQKNKTSFSVYILILDFDIGIAHFYYNNSIKNGGY